MKPNFVPRQEVSSGQPSQRKTARANSLRDVQVTPPDQVDLTLSPSVCDDIRMPAQASGAHLLDKASRVPAKADPLRK